MAEGLIFGIQRFSIDDGPGIRTTVFLKGCNMYCSWCHNPESWEAKTEILWQGSSCVHCGRCAAVCRNEVFAPSGGLNRQGRCTACGRCIKACPQNALQMCGRKIRPQEIMEEVVRDRRYYAASGGGLTISGGEPAQQPEFLCELTELADRAQIRTAVETNGTGAWAVYAAILPFDPLFLVDYKATDEKTHREQTGEERRVVLDTVKRLTGAGARVVLRCPVIPDVNDNPEHFAEIARLSRLHPAVLGFELMPYHAMGTAKMHRLGRIGKEYRQASPAEAACWKEQVIRAGGKEWDYHDRADSTACPPY